MSCRSQLINIKVWDAVALFKEAKCELNSGRDRQLWTYWFLIYSTLSWKRLHTGWVTPQGRLPQSHCQRVYFRSEPPSSPEPNQVVLMPKNRIDHAWRRSKSERGSGLSSPVADFLSLHHKLLPPLTVKLWHPEKVRKVSVPPRLPGQLPHWLQSWSHFLLDTFASYIHFCFHYKPRLIIRNWLWDIDVFFLLSLLLLQPVFISYLYPLHINFIYLFYFLRGDFLFPQLCGKKPTEQKYWLH